MSSGKQELYLKDKSFSSSIAVGFSFLLWGFFPIYWKIMDHVPAFQILAHRTLWSFFFLSILLTWKGSWHDFKSVLSSSKSRYLLIASSVLIATNWLVYIYGVNTDRIIETSLGYFINPLINVLLAIVILRERMNRWKTLAVLLALIGVLILTLQYGRIPWIALTLAFSFGTYGLLRKIAGVESTVGLTLETAILTPVAVLFLIYTAFKGNSSFLAIDIKTDLLCIATGVVTALPLILFTHGVRYIQYTTSGILQYIAPTLQLLVGVIIYNEPFTKTHRLSFGFIWLALLIYSTSSISAYRRMRSDIKPE